MPQHDARRPELHSSAVARTLRAPLTAALCREQTLSAMNRDHVMRVARPTDNLSQIADMYARGLGLAILTRFTNHAGFDGVILGHPQHPYHLEFTSQRGHRVWNRADTGSIDNISPLGRRPPRPWARAR